MIREFKTKKSFENSQTFAKNFQFGRCSSSNNLSPLIEKGKKELMFKVNLGQNSLSHVSESFFISQL